MFSHWITLRQKAAVSHCSELEVAAGAAAALAGKAEEYLEEWYTAENYA